MIVALLSDSHDNVYNIKVAVEMFRDAGAQAIIHAGDIIAPFAAKELLKADMPVYAVFGNCDGEKEHLPEILENIELPPRRFELGGRNFLLVHDPAQVTEKDLENIDIFVHGHTHRYRLEQGTPLIINPGESGGWLTGTPTAAILDTETLEVKKIPLA